MGSCPSCPIQPIQPIPPSPQCQPVPPDGYVTMTGNDIHQNTQLGPIDSLSANALGDKVCMGICNAVNGCGAVVTGDSGHNTRLCYLKATPVSPPVISSPYNTFVKNSAATMANGVLDRVSRTGTAAAAASFGNPYVTRDESSILFPVQATTNVHTFQSRWNSTAPRYI